MGLLWGDRRRKQDVLVGLSLPVLLLILNLIPPPLTEAQQPQPVQFGARKQPGTLLLTILIKNEAEHLKRTLPIWAKLADYWIIGVDRYNTDNSEDVIKEHLGQIPGEIMIVDFDGMGPTWTKLVQRGLEVFPQATHGIMSDADFTPLPETLNKWELDVDCSKHYFSLLEADGVGTRNMDWIYRNIPGVRIERRTHQILQVPGIPGQQRYVSHTGFTLQEHPGGFQDRAGNKSGRYIEWLKKDLEEIPNDSRTIYYLAKEHMELMGGDPVKELRTNGPGAWHVHESLRYYKMRAAMDLKELSPHLRVDEERYWSYLKAAEICERWLRDYECSIENWQLAWDMDPVRADAPYYIGQHYRLRGDGDTAMRYLKKVQAMDMPPRNNHQWPYLYDCLRHAELVRAASRLTRATKFSKKDFQAVKFSYAQSVANCPPDELNNIGRYYDDAIERRSFYRKQKEEAKRAEKENMIAMDAKTGDDPEAVHEEASPAQDNSPKDSRGKKEKKEKKRKEKKEKKKDKKNKNRGNSGFDSEKEL